MQKIATLTFSFCIFIFSLQAQTNTCGLVAGFNASPSAPGTYQFHNTSIGFSNTDSIRWTFGDGSSSNQVNPSHTYTQAGQFNVCIRIQKRNSIGALSNCVSEVCHTIIVGTASNCTLVASFSSTATTPPNTFHFQNTSQGLSPTDSIRWTFGDGTSSNQLSPTHTYTHAGNYTVCIRIQKRNPNGVLISCVKEFCKVVSVTAVTNCDLAASFTGTSTGPATFHFQNTSQGLSPTDSIRWTFGDGTSSNQLSPTHTYTHTGNYTVCIRIQKRNPNGVATSCVKEFCKVVSVASVTSCNLAASFTSTLTGPATFQFLNTSTGMSATDSIRWTFGDGTSSNQLHPTHSYAQPGVYNVCLRIQKRNNVGAATNCVREVCRTVTIDGQANCAIVAGFTSTSIGAHVIRFQNTSTGLVTSDSIRWSFGDGNFSNVRNPEHTYSQPGVYTVCLRVARRTSAGTITNCVREFCKNVTIGINSACNLVAQFTSTPLGSNSYHFQNTSLNVAQNDSIRWTFGDGTSSNQMSPNHTYAQPGRYTVCLRIQKRFTASTLSTCVREICRVVEPTASVSCALPYPNPASNQVNVQVPLVRNEWIHVYIFNASNVLVKEKRQQGYAGSNLVSIMIGELVPGIYSMKVMHENRVCITSFVKL